MVFDFRIVENLRYQHFQYLLKYNFPLLENF